MMRISGQPFRATLGKTCLAIAFPPLVALFLVFMVEHFSRFRSDLAEHQFSQEYQVASGILSLKAKYAEARLAVELMRNSRSPEAEAAFRARQSEVGRLLSSVEAALHSQSTAVFEELRERDRSLNRNFDIFASALNRIGRGDRDGLNGEVFDANLDLRDAVSSNIAALGRWHDMADDLVRRMTVIEHDYRQAQKLRELQMHYDAYDRLKAMLIAAALPSAITDAVNRSLDNYGTKFADWVDVTQYALNVFNRINADHILLTRGLQTLQEKAEIRGREAGTHRAELDAQRRLLLFAALGIVVLAAAGLAVALNRRYGLASTQAATLALSSPHAELSISEQAAIEAAIQEQVIELRRAAAEMRKVSLRVGRSRNAVLAAADAQPPVAGAPGSAGPATAQHDKDFAA